MSAIAAMLKGRIRLALAVVLALAVLIAGSGAHPDSYCCDHADGHAAEGVLPVVAGPVGPADAVDGDGPCLSCDCPCQTACPAGRPAIVVPAGAPLRLVRSPGPTLPDGVVPEVDPPPVRTS